MKLKVKIYLVLLVIFSFIILPSCDPVMDLSLKIKNNTTEELVVEFKALHNHNQDTTINVDIGKEASILNVSRREKAKHYDCCPCEVGSLNIFTVDSISTSMKNYENKDNWIKINDNKRKVNCTLVIDDEDLE